MSRNLWFLFRDQYIYWFNDKEPKFKVGDHVKMWKYKNIFAKRYTPNWSEDVFVTKEVKTAASWTWEEIIETFYKKELQKTNQQGFRIEKVIKRKGNKLYVKWKGYYNSFNSWIDKRDLIQWNYLV